MSAETPTKITPEEQKMRELMERLITHTTTLVVKVATCKCNHTADCAVYQKAREIAELIDQIQEMREKGGSGG